MRSEFILGVFQWLAVLACPIMMLLCIRGMSDRGCHRQDQPGAGKSSTGSELPENHEAEIRELKARLARLESDRARSHDHRPEVDP